MYFGLSCIVATASAVVSVETVTNSPVVDGRPLYKYAYAVKDIKTGDTKSVREERDGDFTKGFYSLLQPDGIVRTVVYDVGPTTGFNAVVSNAPGPIANIHPVIWSEVPVSVVAGVNVHGGVDVNRVIPRSPLVPPSPQASLGHGDSEVNKIVPSPPPVAPPQPQAIGQGAPVVIPLEGNHEPRRLVGFRPSPLVGNPHGVNGFLPGISYAAIGPQRLRAIVGTRIPDHLHHQGPRSHHRGFHIFRGHAGPALGGVRPEGLQNVVGGIGPIFPGTVPVVGPLNPGSWVVGQRGVGQPFTIGNWAGGVGGTGAWGNRIFDGIAGPFPLVAGHRAIPGIWARGHSPIIPTGQVAATQALVRGGTPLLGVSPVGVHWGGRVHGIPIHRSGILAAIPAPPTTAPVAHGTT